MKAVTLTIIFVCLNLGVLVGQNIENKELPTEYNRNALTVMILDKPGKFRSDLVSASPGIIVPDKFDDNNITQRTLSSSTTALGITDQIYADKTVNEILSKWFSRDSLSGEFNMSVIHERGMYNATDDEVLRASASKIGLANLKDAGESLIQHSYILVLDFNDIESMQQVYNRRDVAKRATAELMNNNYQPVNRVKNGWLASAKGYLFKLNFSDSVMNVFYDDLWIYEDDDEETKKQKRALFDETEFPIEFVTQVYGNADGTQYKAGHPMSAPIQLSKVGLFTKLVNTGLGSCVQQVEKAIDAFKVKSPVYKTKPIRSKVGKKEGLKTDQRYFVMEFYQNRKGDMDSRRIAVTRVRKATDNRENASGNSNDYSTFYQVAGFGIEPGMLLYQENDFGLGVSGGVSIGEIAGGWGKIELNVARMAAGIGDIGVTQLKLFGYLGFDSKDYDVLNQGTSYDMSFIRWQAGISKGFYFRRRMSLAPFVAFGAESGSNSQMNYDFGLKSNDFIGADFFNAGISGNFNLVHWLQAYASVNYIMFFPYTYTKQRTFLDYGVFNNKKYHEVFEDRKGLSIDLGIRLEF